MSTFVELTFHRLRLAVSVRQSHVFHSLGAWLLGRGLEARQGLLLLRELTTACSETVRGWSVFASLFLGHEHIVFHVVLDDVGRVARLQVLPFLEPIFVGALHFKLHFLLVDENRRSDGLVCPDPVLTCVQFEKRILLSLGGSCLFTFATRHADR